MSHGEAAIADPEQLEQIIDQMHAVAVTATVNMLHAIAAHDDGEVWRRDYVTSMSMWLSARLGVKETTARDWVRMAHSLVDLPEISSVAGEGGLSLDQLRAVTRFATSETDLALAKEAPTCSASSLELQARRHERLQADREEPRSFLRMWSDRGRGLLKFHGQLVGDDGETFRRAVERRADQLPRDLDLDGPAPHDEQLAVALVDLAAQQIAHDPDADRATVVVHVSETAITGGPGLAELEQGTQLHISAVQRLLCDGRIELAVEGLHGQTIGIRRASRIVPPAIQRAVIHRDQTCQAPGCDRTALLHIHHAIPWIAGGRTNLDNLKFKLCCHRSMPKEFVAAAPTDARGKLKCAEQPASNRIWRLRGPPRLSGTCADLAVPVWPRRNRTWLWGAPQPSGCSSGCRPSGTHADGTFRHPM